MPKPRISDELWAFIEPLLPPEPPPPPKGGRPRIRNRAALAGIVFVLKSGMPGEMVPRELDCALICWRCVIRFC